MDESPCCCFKSSLPRSNVHVDPIQTQSQRSKSLKVTKVMATKTLLDLPVVANTKI